MNKHLLEILGWKSHSHKSSNIRRIYGRALMLSVFVLSIQLVLSGDRPTGNGSWIGGLLSLALIAYGLAYFTNSIFLMPFRDSNTFRIAAGRLLFETIISSIFLVFAFSMLYRTFGLKPEGTYIDALYFSAVTFSTLGYGDFAPTPSLRLWAAAEALIGNLHLGFIVGATFAALKGRN